MNTVTTEFKLELYSAPTSTWVDITEYVRANSLRIENAINTRSVMSFTLFDRADVLTVPSVGQQVRVSDVKNSVRAYYFGGQISLVDYGQLSNGNPYTMEIQCQDWSCLLDRYYVTAAFTGQTSGSIVTALIGEMDSLDALDATDVADGPIIAQMNVPTITIQDALDELARETGYKYWVTYDKKLHWQPKTGSTATWQLSEEESLTHVYGPPRVVRDRAQYRNRQEVRGGVKADDQYQFYPPDPEPGMPGEWMELDMIGPQSFVPPVFDLGRPISKVFQCYICDTPIGMIERIEKDAGLQFPGMAGPKGSEALFYYTAGDHYLYVSEKFRKPGDPTEYYAHEVFPLGKTMYVWCDVQFQNAPIARAQKDTAFCLNHNLDVEDTIEQIRAIEGGSGIVFNLEIDERIETMEQAQEKADALIKEYGIIPTVITYTSDDWGDLTVGQSQTCTIYGLNKVCHVNSIRISDVDRTWLRAEIELIGSERQGFAQHWRSLYGGQTTKMRSTYAVRPSALPTATQYISSEAATVSSVSLTTTEIASGVHWGTGKIGAGAEWA